MGLGLRSAKKYLNGLSGHHRFIFDICIVLATCRLGIGNNKVELSEVMGGG